uniref:Uncharacterized protein n=1 Tax=Melanopsichium pennsylvanicum 4 TaxID=1398559 RepID=A0A077R445_9BASI|nr:uncharacterized protein BN887_06031 [Melanopsichium pennsylvanicum 4]
MGSDDSSGEGVGVDNDEDNSQLALIRFGAGREVKQLTVDVGNAILAMKIVAPKIERTGSGSRFELQNDMLIRGLMFGHFAVQNGVISRIHAPWPGRTMSLPPKFTASSKLCHAVLRNANTLARMQRSAVRIEDVGKGRPKLEWNSASKRTGSSAVMAELQRAAVKKSERLSISKILQHSADRNLFVTSCVKTYPL